MTAKTSTKKSSLSKLLETKDQIALKGDDDHAKKGKDFCKRVYEVMLQSRIMDEKQAKLVRQNKGGTFHMNALGHEMIGAVSALTLTPGTDWAFPYYRDRGFALGFGSCMVELFGTFLGRETSHHSKGRMMPDHYSHKGLNIPVQSSVVGSQFLQAAGLAKGLQLSGKNDAVYVSGGDGSTSQGDFHEMLNFASVHKLGLVVVIQDNGWAISVPVKDQTAGGSVAKIGSGYEGLEVFEVDGSDFEKVSKALTKAKQRANECQGPTLIVAKVPRLGPHSSSDDPKKYKSEEAIAQEIEKDPILFFEKYLKDMGLYSESELEQIRESVREDVEACAKMAEKLPFPDPKTVSNHVLTSHTQSRVILKDEKPQESIVMVDSINHALAEEMERDASVVVYGQDVAWGKGGVFGATRYLTEKFGEKRCFNSPLAESMIIGTAIGMSFDGKHKPVVEIQFADYLWTGINQLFNELSSISYRSGGEWNCPVVVRMPIGGYIQGGPYHSQSIEGFLTHCPGLKVVYPSNAADAKRLLKAAIRDPNPVIFLEHKGLYRQRSYSARPEPHVEEVDVIGKAEVVKGGSDVTVVTWGMMTVMAVDAATSLESKGVSVEVIDLKTLSPFDEKTVFESVKKTGKCLVLQEAPVFCGYSSEVSAKITESIFTYLDAPVMRIGSVDSAVPYSKVLEDAHLPQKQDVMDAIVKLNNY